MRWLKLGALFFFAGIPVHGLTVLFTTTTYFGGPLAVLGVTWFSVGLVLGSLLQLPQCAMYVRNYRRYGRGVALLGVFICKLAFTLVFWPFMLVAVAWDWIAASEEPAMGVRETLDKDFEEEDSLDEADWRQRGQFS
ncbi:MAG TPA: hypothetical protein VEL76_27250 [Gemmataceae bacterium]|nr:hypothetical protein [Gemmataceae bacterium]